MFDHVDRVLQELAHGSGQGLVDHPYLDAQRILRQWRKAILVDFLRMLRQEASLAMAPSPRPEAGRPPQDEPDSQELSLPQDADLEESLAIGNLITKAEARYRPELLEMRLHLARLLHRSRLPERSNPYGPFAVCEAFRRSLLLAHPLEASIRLVIYKYFDRYLMNQLGDFYRGCVDLASAEGHVPGGGFQHLLRRGVHATARAPAAAASGPGVQRSATLSFQALRGLLDLQRPAASRPAPHQVGVQTDDLLEVLSNLGVATLTEGMVVGMALRDRLNDAISVPGTGAPTLAREDEDTLDLVFLFFEQLLQGTDLPESIKVLLARLQAPVAQIALLDKTFFTDQGHVARRLLNRIGQAAMGWSEDDDRGPDSLFGTIEQVVERLVLDGSGSPALFTRMDRTLAAYIGREESSARSLEANILASLEPAPPESDQQIVADLAEDFLARYPTTPPVVEAIIREGWQGAMLAVYRQSGTDSSAWRRGLELAEQLLWSVQPKLDAQERRQLLRRIPEILRGLRDQFSVAGNDQRQLARWFRDLQTFHLAALQGEPLLPDPGAGTPEGSPARALAVGTWVELRRDGGGTRRLKVAWVSADGGRYLLVDRRGRRGPELGRRELSSLVDGGLARILPDEQEPIVDRAFRSVLARLAS